MLPDEIGVVWRPLDIQRGSSVSFMFYFFLYLRPLEYFGGSCEIKDLGKHNMLARTAYTYSKTELQCRGTQNPQVQGSET